MQCPHCGKKTVEQARFCSNCGGLLANIKGRPPITTPQNNLRTAANRGENDDTPEEVLWHGSFSKLAMIGYWVAAAGLSLVSMGIALFTSISGQTWLVLLAFNAVVWLGLIARYFYLRFSRNYALSDQRFTHVRGLLWRQTDRIEVIDIDDVSFSQGPVERILGIGTVRITSSDQTHPELALPGIENVQIVAGQIDDARRRERRKRGLYIESV